MARKDNPRNPLKTTQSLARSREDDLVNIGAGQEFSIRHFARLICKQVGYDFQAIQFDTSRYVGARSKCLSTGKLRQLVPGIQFTPLETGLARTIQWFRTDGQNLLAKDAPGAGARTR